MPLPDHDGQDRADLVKKFQIVLEKHEVVATRVLAGSGITGVDPHEFAERVYDRTLDKIMDGTFDPSRGSVEVFMKGVALRLCHEELKQLYRVKRAKDAILGHHHDEEALEQGPPEPEILFDVGLIAEGAASALDRREREMTRLMDDDGTLRRTLRDEAADELASDRYQRARDLATHIALIVTFRDLREQDREILYRRFWLQESSKNVAHSVGLPSKDTVDKRASRVYMKVRANFEQECKHLGIPES